MGLVDVDDKTVIINPLKAPTWSKSYLVGNPDTFENFESTWRKAHNNKTMEIWANTDRYAFVLCEVVQSNSCCKIQCRVIAGASILLNISRAKDYNKQEWTEIYGHEQQHILGFAKFIKDIIVDPLRKENEQPCDQNHAKKLTENYKSKIDQFLASQDHKGTPGATNDSPEEMKPSPPPERQSRFTGATRWI